MLKDKKDRKLITFHESMNYFAAPESFNLKIVKVIERKAGDKPTSGELKDLVAECKKEGVRVIAREPQYEEGAENNPAVLLKKELEKSDKDAQLITLDPLETAKSADLQNADWYEKKMRENLKALAEALK
jgi:ABC-type Zn uptake system ZnuABC Zn-binding protein ZnuA